MQIVPTWDLFILVFFAIIVAYSLIIGRNHTLKIIIASYIAVLATDGLVNFVHRALLSEDAIINVFTTADAGNLTVLKIVFFVLAIVILTTRGGFGVQVAPGAGFPVRFLLAASFGFLSAGLIISTVLVYISGGSFITSPLTGLAPAVIDITTDSYLARTMTENYNFWFSFPALAFVVASFMGGSKNEDDELEEDE